jgi:hypothetical protein
MDGIQVQRFQEIIRDDMVKYLSALESIKAIVNDHNIEQGSRIQTIKHICAVVLKSK